MGSSFVFLKVSSSIFSPLGHWLPHKFKPWSMSVKCLWSLLWVNVLPLLPVVLRMSLSVGHRSLPPRAALCAVRSGRMHWWVQAPEGSDGVESQCWTWDCPGIALYVGTEAVVDPSPPPAKNKKQKLAIRAVSSGQCQLCLHISLCLVQKKWKDAMCYSAGRGVGTVGSGE